MKLQPCLDDTVGGFETRIGSSCTVFGPVFRLADALKKALKRQYNFLLQFSRKSKVKSSTVIDLYYVENYEINYFYLNCPLWFSNSCRWSTQSSQGMEGKNQKSSFHVQMHVSFIAYFHTKKIRISNSDFSLNFLTIEVALMKSKRHCCWNHQSKISDNLDLGFCEKMWWAAEWIN